MQIIHAPRPDTAPAGLPRLFLAGTIDMGKSTDWQARLATELGGCAAVLLNPRRGEWDATWDNSSARIHPQLKEQIHWELDQLERADLVALWFEATSRSPISLLEMGLHLRSGKVVIGCPPAFYRAANVYLTALKYNVAVHPDWPQFVTGVKTRLESFG